MGYITEPDGVLLYVEHRQPTEEEDRLFREWMQARTTALATTAPSEQPAHPTAAQRPQRPARKKKQAGV